MRTSHGQKLWPLREGKFLKVGTKEEIEVLQGENTKVANLGRKICDTRNYRYAAHPFSGVDLGTGSINLTNPGIEMPYWKILKSMFGNILIKNLSWR